MMLNKSSVSLGILTFVFVLTLNVLALGQESSLFLPLNKTVEKQIKSEEIHIYTVNLRQGQVLRVDVQEKGVDLRIQFRLREEKQIIASANFGKGFDREVLTRLIDNLGEYELSIIAPKQISQGSYDLRAKITDTKSENDIQQIAAERLFSEGLASKKNGTANDLQTAVEKFQEAISIWKKLNEKYWEGIAGNFLGEVLILSGDSNKALTIFTRTLQIFKEINNKNGIPVALINVGTAHYYLGEPQTALEYFSQALTLIRQVGDINTEVSILSSLGVIYEGLGQTEKSLKFHLQASEFLNQVDDKKIKATTFNNIGVAYDTLGQREKALEYYNKALPLIKEVGDKGVEAALLSNIGSVYYFLKETEKALEIYQKALPLIQQIGDKKTEATILTNMGYSYEFLGKNEKALEFFQNALPIRREIGDKVGEAQSLNGIGTAYYFLKNDGKALEYFNQALPVLKQVGDKNTEAMTLHNIMETWQNLNNERQGVFFGKQSLNLYQQLRSDIQELDKNTQQTFLKSIEDSYRRLTDLLLSQGRLTEAQQVLNSFKDQSYFDFDEKQQLRPLTNTPREEKLMLLYQKTTDALSLASREITEFRRNVSIGQTNDNEKKQLKQLEAKLKTAQDDFDNFLKQANKEFASQPTDEDKVTETEDLKQMQIALSEISTQTGDKTVTVYTLVGTDKFSILIITADGIETVSYPIKAEDLNKKTLQLWKLLQSPQYDPKPTAQALYQIVFAPIALKLAKDTKTILWSLDGNLRYVPMATLHDGKDYLVENYQNVLFTRADMDRLTKNVTQKWTGTGLGSSQGHTINLLGEKIELDALFGVDVELNRIFKQTNQKAVFDGDILLDKDFTKPAMIKSLEKKRPLVHIASHFKFEPGDESRSFLLLGNGEAMTIDEMKKEKYLFQGVELLTLSACETAAQRPDANGREVDAFAELAQRLGAGAVMASLWDLSDNSTAELMTRFYQIYDNGKEKGKMSKAEALQKAQISLLSGEYKEISKEALRNPIKENKELENIKIEKSKLIPVKRNKKAPYAHPFYWSPFVLYGNWK